MSRIHEALARARAIGSAGGVLPAESSDEHDQARLPMAPTEWVPEPMAPTEWAPEQTAQPRLIVPALLSDPIVPALLSDPIVPALPSDPIGPPAGSNGHATAQVWAFSPKLKEKLVVEDGVDHAAVEQYRRLAAALHLAQGVRGSESVKIVMIASSVSSEGKTLTSVNLALTLSESYHRRVLLVDGDLRRPWLHEVFQVSNVGGLNDTLTSPDPKIAILQVSNTLSVLTAGRAASDPMRVLSSERMGRVLHDVRARFDWVLLDTPPITLLSDASLLASKADVVILVVEAGKTRFEIVQSAVEAIGRDRIVGIVLNRVQRGPSSVYAQQESQGPDGS
jgi:protein-tyrosine kinase